MRLCVLNCGPVHPILRTLAMSRLCTITEFIETGPRNQDHALLEKAGIKVSFLSMQEKRSTVSLWQHLRTVGADAFVCHYAAGGHVYACLLAGKRPLSLIAMGNDILMDEGDIHLSGLEKMVVKAAIKRADFISAKSHTLRRRLEDWSVQCPIDVNYWGIDLSLFQPGDKSGARRRLGLPLSKKLILSARNFEPRCNVHLVAQSFAEVAHRIPEVEMVFIGWRSDREYYEHVRSILRDAGLENRSHVFPDLPALGVIPYYQAADVSVSIARADGFPNSVLEMMACGTPLIVGRIPQTEELLQHEVNAILCDLSVEDVTRHLAWALDDASILQMQRMAATARETTIVHADIHKNAIRFVNNIRSLSKEGRRSFPWAFLFLLALFFLSRKLGISRRHKREVIG